MLEANHLTYYIYIYIIHIMCTYITNVQPVIYVYLYFFFRAKHLEAWRLMRTMRQWQMWRGALVSLDRTMTLRGWYGDCFLACVAENLAGWWFQAFYIFHNIWDNHSHWLSYFSIWLKPPTSLICFGHGPFLVDWLTDIIFLASSLTYRKVWPIGLLLLNLTTVNNKYGSNRQRAVRSYGQIPKLGSQGASLFGWLVSYLNQSPNQKRKHRGLRKKKKTVFRRNPILVDGLDFFYFPYIGNNPPNWRTPSFFRG